jgi:hypothetical protein
MAEGHVIRAFNGTPQFSVVTFPSISLVTVIVDIAGNLPQIIASCRRPASNGFGRF